MTARTVKQVISPPKLDGMPRETAEVYRAKLATPHADTLLTLMAGLDHADRLPVESVSGMDYKKLWEDLKSELQQTVDHKMPVEYANELVGWAIDPEEPEDLQDVAEVFFRHGVMLTLNDMLQAETLAMVMK